MFGWDTHVGDAEVIAECEGCLSYCGSGIDAGECRRRSPVVNNDRGWPRVKADAWCGEWDQSKASREKERRADRKEWDNEKRKQIAAAPRWKRWWVRWNLKGGGVLGDCRL